MITSFSHDCSDLLQEVKMAPEDPSVEWGQARTDVARRFAAQIDKTQAVADCILRLLTAKIFKGTAPEHGDQLVFYVVMALLTKAFKSHRAIVAVATEGLGEDANALLRALFETATAVDFILRDESALRTRVYLAYVAHRRLVIYKSWRGTPSLRDKVSDEDLARAQRNVDERVAALPKDTNYESHWSGHRNLEQLLQHLDAIEGYHTFYRFASAIAHASDAEDHLALTPEGVLSMNLFPGDKFVENALVLAPALLWMTASNIDRSFQLGWTPALAGVRPPQTEEQ
jgi:Family of unknown function (DUF5677)